MTTHYPIGTPGQPWGDKDKAAWLAAQTIKRSYSAQVLDKLAGLSQHFELIEYGQLHGYPKHYPLYILKSKTWASDKPLVFISGGVHGYETSGVQGAIRFAASEAAQYTERVNLLIAPCISPWGYETLNRWNPSAIDPNRSFYTNSPAEEAAALMRYIAGLNGKVSLHIDLHETTDTDNSEFRPALAARDAEYHELWDIPDGFYLVGDSQNPAPALQSAIIKRVKKITHIAPADDSNKIIGEALQQPGVINYPCKKLGLCAGFTNAQYCTTTEVYPDSPLVDDENCIAAQVAAILGGIEFVLEAEGL